MWRFPKRIHGFVEYADDNFILHLMVARAYVPDVTVGVPQTAGLRNNSIGQ